MLTIQNEMDGAIGKGRDVVFIIKVNTHHNLAC
jgi:hypothetical protein